MPKSPKSQKGKGSNSNSMSSTASSSVASTSQRKAAAKSNILSSSSSGSGSSNSNSSSSVSVRNGGRNEDDADETKISKGKARMNQQGKGVKKSSASQSRAPKQLTSAELLDQVEELIDGMELEAASQMTAEILETEPNNVRALEAMGIILLESGHPKEAYDSFTQAAQLSPNDGANKYMYLGQMQTGQEAFDAFKKGVEIMQREKEQLILLKKGQNDEHIQELSSQIATALCSMAELYLTDLCFEENAETECESLLENALKEDPHNPEVYQTMASYQISKQNPDRAQEYMVQSLKLWHVRKDGEANHILSEKEHNSKDLMDEDDDDDNNVDYDIEENDENEGLIPLPPYEFRLNTAKILMELELYDEASSVLGQLIREDDEVVNAWYLFGWLYHLVDDFPASLECLTTAKNLHTRLQCDDEPMLQHINELLEHIEVSTNL